MRFFQLLSVALTACTSLVSAAKYSNPIKNPNGSDPHVVFTGGYYYLTTTTWSDIQITRAKTIEGLKTGERKTVWKDTNASRCCNVWAPEMHYLNNIWYIYYTAGTSANLDGQRIHVLKGGANVFDTYTYAGQLTSEWGIDGTVARFSSGNYFVWSCFMNGSPQSLCIAKLNSPTSIGARSLLSQPTNAWERVRNPVNEGPAAMYHGGKTFLTFSASDCWTSSYQLGLLTWNGGDPLLPASWKKTGPVFSSSNGNYGTGHNGFFQSPDGTEIWNVYHATADSAGKCDGNRYTMFDKVNWNSDGSPNFGRALSLGTQQNGPSGE